jgi:APA family basic amino acid/polyamine antiporter
MGFGLALVFGTMVGVGILRLPGAVAQALGDRTLVMLAWGLGGLYALMGAVAVAELAAMIPETGGFRVYARRAFGEGVAFFGALWQPVTAFQRAAAVLLLTAFTAIHWIGLRIGSSLTAIISSAIGIMLMILLQRGIPVGVRIAVSPAEPNAAVQGVGLSGLNRHRAGRFHCFPDCRGCGGSKVGSDCGCFPGVLCAGVWLDG